MTSWTAAILTALQITLAAAPGEAPATRDDIPRLTQEALNRRLGPAARMSDLRIRPSRRMPGFAVCGRVAASGKSAQRFFVVIPGTFAVLDDDDRELVSKYWSLNDC